MAAKNDTTGDTIISGKGNHKAVCDNWPWTDPFEERMKLKREEEARRAATASYQTPP